VPNSNRISVDSNHVSMMGSYVPHDYNQNDNNVTNLMKLNAQHQLFEIMKSGSTRT
jgi:hypothetical protein